MARSWSHGWPPRGPEECEICTMFVEPNERHWSCGPCGFRICKTCAIEIMQGTVGELANGNKKGGKKWCDWDHATFFMVFWWVITIKYVGDTLYIYSIYICVFYFHTRAIKSGLVILGAAFYFDNRFWYTCSKGQWSLTKSGDDDGWL